MKKLSQNFVDNFITYPDLEVERAAGPEVVDEPAGEGRGSGRVRGVGEGELGAVVTPGGGLVTNQQSVFCGLVTNHRPVLTWVSSPWLAAASLSHTMTSPRVVRLYTEL